MPDEMKGKRRIAGWGATDRRELAVMIELRRGIEEDGL
jgi:hypothetical protein